MSSNIVRLAPPKPVQAADDHPVKGLGEMLRKSARKPRQHEPGELDGYGRCMDCGENWSGNVGVYYCEHCSEE